MGTSAWQPAAPLQAASQQKPTPPPARYLREDQQPPPRVIGKYGTDPTDGFIKRMRVCNWMSILLNILLLFYIAYRLELL